MTPAENLVQSTKETLSRIGSEQVESLLQFLATETTKAVAVRSHVAFSRILGPVSEEDLEGYY